MDKNELKLNHIYQGNSLDVLKTLPDESINCIVTSPPYWKLRRYTNNPKEIGIEKTFYEYIDNLILIFDEIKRILKNDGVCFVNLGDTYSGTKNGNTEIEKNFKVVADTFKKEKQDIPDRSLCLIPYRFAIKMVEHGWLNRNIICWYKRNQMPQSAKNRFTVDFEPIMMFTKNEKYYFKTQYEPYAPGSDVEYRKTLRLGKFYRTKEPYKKNVPYSHKNLQEKGQKVNSMHKKRADGDREFNYNLNGKLMRCVWDIPTQPSNLNHHAMFPDILAHRMIDAGCPKNGIVLDPFCGSNTVGKVAQEKGINWIGIDIDEKCIEEVGKIRTAQKTLMI